MPRSLGPRMFVRVKPSGPRQYLQIVENYREDGRVRQRVIATLGRPDRLSASGQVDGLVRSRGRSFEFPLERAVFVSVLHRLFGAGSDRQADRWRVDHRIDGAEAIRLHHLYRAMRWLAESREPIEESLFAQRRDLFTMADVVFFDTTSIYFEGRGGETLGRQGHSKDHRPDRPR